MSRTVVRAVRDESDDRHGAVARKASHREPERVIRASRFLSHSRERPARGSRRLGGAMKRSVVTALMVGCVVSGGLLAAQNKEWSFPRTRSYGRATTEYNGKVHVVINYDYSQRKHGSKWLLLDIAMSSVQRFVLHKGDLKLLTPNG